MKEYFYEKVERMRYEFVTKVYMRDDITKEELAEYFEQETNP